MIGGGGGGGGAGGGGSCHHHYTSYRVHTIPLSTDYIVGNPSHCGG